jgi:hypothetical protein
MPVPNAFGTGIFLCGTAVLTVEPAGFQPVAMNGQDAFTWKTGFQSVMAERVILFDGQDARRPSQARCLTSDSRMTIVRSTSGIFLCLIALVIPSEVEESLADHEENLLSEGVAWDVAWILIRFDIKPKQRYDLRS